MNNVTDKAAIDYALRYGGMCRDCADTSVRGICDNSGMPCDPEVCRKVISHALGAWRYGIKHGFVPNPLSPPSGAEEARRMALEEALVLVLPMAKGYAAAHPVGANSEKIQQAENVLNEA